MIMEATGEVGIDRITPNTRKNATKRKQNWLVTECEATKAKNTTEK